MVDASLSSGIDERTGTSFIKNEDEVTNKYLLEALKESKREGLELAVKARSISLVAVAILIVYLVQDWSALYYLALISLFILNGLAQLRIGRVGRSRMEIVLLIVDLLLMGVAVGVPNPFAEETWNMGMQFKYGNFPYFYILAAGATLAYSWRTMFAVIWWTILIWGSVYLWGYFEQPILPEITEQMRLLLIDHPHIFELVNPNELLWHGRVQEIVLFLIVCGIMMLNGWRTNRLLVRQAEAARERANLARYFAPTMVDHLAGKDQPLGDVRSQPVVVMFVDIVGFTKMAEQDAPEIIVRFLREFHGRMEKVVFDHGGTLDKFLGDGIMVTFGTPAASADDANNAVNCAVAMQDSIENWNKDRAARNLPPIKLSVGLHYGDVVLGDIGSERRLEYTVLGDVVNVSSRLEALTRELGASVVASDAVINAADDNLSAIAKFKDAGPQQLRGRDEPVKAYMVPRNA